MILHKNKQISAVEHPIKNHFSPVRKHKKNNDHASFIRLFNGSSDAVILLWPDMQIECANTAAHKFFNFSGENASGRYFKDCVPAASWDKLMAAVKHVRREVLQSRLELEAIDGHRRRVLMETTIFPIIDHKQIAGYFVSLRDVSQERQIEELVRESQKMEAIQFFVSGTTKELQQPLLAILKRIESIEHKYKGRSFEYVSFKEFTQIMDFLEVMGKQIKTCYETTSKLNNINKKRLKFESHYCQVNTVARDIIRNKEQNFINSNIKTKLSLLNDLPSAAIGELELNQIINHLVDNAIQSMPGGGRLSIGTTILHDAGQIKIEISDDGVGISPEDLPHIFEPFFTTRHGAFNRSAGLGLTIVYSLVKAANGQIHVKSSLRKGTTVQLILPVARYTPKPQSAGK